MNGDQEYHFSTLNYVGTIVLSQQRGIVEVRRTLLREARVSLFPLQSLSPVWSFGRVITSFHIGLLVMFAVNVFATIGVDLIAPLMPRSSVPAGYAGVNVFFWAGVALSGCFAYLVWRDSKIRWYTFFGPGSGPNFAFPEDQTGGMKARDFAEQLGLAIRASRFSRGDSY